MPNVFPSHGDPVMSDLPITPTELQPNTVLVINDYPFVIGRHIPALGSGAMAARNGVYRGTPAQVQDSGETVYWDETNEVFTTVAGTNIHFGYAVDGGSKSGTTETYVLHAPRGA